MEKNAQQALRQAAQDLIRQKGLARTTARDLAGASGANLRSIGYHFGSKDGLMAEALAQISAEWTAIGVDAARGAGADASAAARMTTAVTRILSDLSEKRADLLVMLEGITEARHNPALADSLRQTQGAAQDAIAASILAGAPDLPTDVALQLTRLLMAVHDGLAMQAAIDDTPALRDVAGLVQALAGLGVTLAAGLRIPGADALLESLLSPDADTPEDR